MAKRRTSANVKTSAGKPSAARALGIKRVAADLGVSAKWIRGQIATGTVAPKRAGGKGDGRFLFTAEDLETLRLAKAAEPPADEETTAIARISRLEADRTNLLAQVAWARAVAQEQQKALEIERERAEKLAAELEAQRTRIERLKALSALDRLLGRHKAI